MRLKTERNTIEVLERGAEQKEVIINGRSLGRGIVFFCSPNIKDPEMIEPSKEIIGNVLVILKEEDSFPLYASGPITEIIEP